MKFLIEEIEHGFDYGQGYHVMGYERFYAGYDPETDSFFCQVDENEPEQITSWEFNRLMKDFKCIAW